MRNSMILRTIPSVFLALTLGLSGVNEASARGPKNGLRTFSDPAVQSVLGTEHAQKFCRIRRLVNTDEKFSECMMNLIVLPAMHFCRTASQQHQEIHFNQQAGDVAEDPAAYVERACLEPARGLLCALRQEYRYQPTGLEVGGVRNFRCDETQLTAFNPSYSQYWNFIIQNQVLPDLGERMTKIKTAEEMNEFIRDAQLSDKERARNVGRANQGRARMNDVQDGGKVRNGVGGHR